MSPETQAYPLDHENLYDTRSIYKFIIKKFSAQISRKTPDFAKIRLGNFAKIALIPQLLGF